MTMTLHGYKLGIVEFVNRRLRALFLCPEVILTPAERILLFFDESVSYESAGDQTFGEAAETFGEAASTFGGDE